MNYKRDYSSSGGFGCSGCFEKVFFVLFFCVLLSECMNRCGCTNDSKTNSPAADSVPVYTDEDFNAYLDSIIAAQDTTATDTSQTTQTKEKPLKIAPNTTTTNRHSAAYEEGRQKGYNMGEEDAIARGGWQAGYDDTNSYEGEEHDDYVRGYNDGYEDGYNDNYEEEQDGED